MNFIDFRLHLPWVCLSKFCLIGRINQEYFQNIYQKPQFTGYLLNTINFFGIIKGSKVGGYNNWFSSTDCGPRFCLSTLLSLACWPQVEKFSLHGHRKAATAPDIPPAFKTKYRKGKGSANSISPFSRKIKILPSSLQEALAYILLTRAVSCGLLQLKGPL